MCLIFDEISLIFIIIIMEILFCVRYETKFGENVCLVGSPWDNWKKLIPMTWNKGGLWSCRVPVSLNEDVVEYKYVVVDNQNLLWESSDNRKVMLKTAKQPDKKRTSFMALIDAWNYPLCTKVITSCELTLKRPRKRNASKSILAIQHVSKTRHNLAM